MSVQELRVSELGLVGEHVAVGVGGHGEVSLADRLANRRSRYPA
jgi:hypothetical protein